MSRVIDNSAYLECLWEEGRISQLEFERDLSPLEKWLIHKLIFYGCDFVEELQEENDALNQEIRLLEDKIIDLETQLEEV